VLGSEKKPGYPRRRAVGRAVAPRDSGEPGHFRASQSGALQALGASIDAVQRSRELARGKAAIWSLSVAAALAAGSCGGSDKKSSDSGAVAAGALSAEAQSAATGDIPDNQVFLVFRNRPAGYSIKYPEGWTQIGAGRSVTFKDKNNLVHIVVGSRSRPTPRQASAELAALQRSNQALTVTAPPRQVTIHGTTMVKSGYATKSAPNPVTGRRVTLVVDRYEVGGSGKTATVDLGTPKGVDNVDAYRLMIESFRWL
jgi:hypothetical protein